MNDAYDVHESRTLPVGGALGAFFYWYAFIAPARIIGIWKNYLAANLNYFSIGLLFRTLLSPWHRTTEAYRNSGHPMDYVEAAVFNGVSRIIGLIIRLVTIAIGLVLELVLLVLGPFVLLLWYAAPFLLSISLFWTPVPPLFHAPSLPHLPNVSPSSLLHGS